MWATSFPIHQIRGSLTPKDSSKCSNLNFRTANLAKCTGLLEILHGFSCYNSSSRWVSLWPVFPPIFWPRRYIQKKQSWYSYLLAKQASSVINSVLQSASMSIFIAHTPTCLYLWNSLLSFFFIFPLWSHRIHVWAIPSLFSVELLTIGMKNFRKSAGRSEMYLIAATIVLILEQKAHSWFHLFWFSRAHFLQSLSHRVIVLLDVLLKW